jgi:hypothetical protein
VITADDGTGEVCFELTVEGLDEEDAVVAAHIHVGDAGVAGDVVVPLFTEPPTGEMTGCVSGVDLELIAAMIADPAGYYVNIHTEDFPDGAVRGQLQVAGVPTGECTLLVSVGDGEPSESVTVQLGDPSLGGDGTALASVNVFGSFIGDADVELTFTHDGTVAFTDTVTADADGNIDLLFGFENGDEGTWVLQAVVPETECAATAEVIVVPFVPAATATPAAPVLPDTGLADPATGSGAWAAIAAAAVLMGAVVVRLLARQRR